MAKDSLVSRKQVMTMLGIERTTFSKLAKSGRLAPVKVPGMNRVRYRLEDVQAVIQGERPPADIAALQLKGAKAALAASLGAGEVGTDKATGKRYRVIPEVTNFKGGFNARDVPPIVAAMQDERD